MARVSVSHMLSALVGLGLVGLLNLLVALALRYLGLGVLKIE